MAKPPSKRRRAPLHTSGCRSGRTSSRREAGHRAKPHGAATAFRASAGWLSGHSMIADTITRDSETKHSIEICIEYVVERLESFEGTQNNWIYKAENEGGKKTMTRDSETKHTMKKMHWLKCEAFRKHRKLLDIHR